MADIVVTARIIAHSNGNFGIVVSSAPADATEDVITTELETGEADNRARAEIVQQRLIGIVLGKSYKRGHNVVSVKRVEFPSTVSS